MTTAATHAGFIADIVEHPEDDSIRLIYTDWLEEHGDPERAEFIRVQVELWASYGNRLDRLRPSFRRTSALNAGRCGSGIV